MTGLLAAAEPIDWARVLVATSFGAVGVWLGLRTWQGRFPGPSGPRPRYQTYFGAAHVSLRFGAGFVLLGSGELVRGALDLSRQGALFWTISLVAVGLWALAAVYLVCYFWVGVPSRWRPPHQRDDPHPDPRRASLRARLRTLRQPGRP